MRPDFDAVVVGAGVIGLAVARELSLSGKAVMVLEKAVSAGKETSSRNSEVIHAGIYYQKASLKARFCVEGRELLYDYCASNGVETKRVGKIIVATSAEEEKKLHSIMALAASNGVHDLQWLSPSDVSGLEPEVRCTRALLSPSTGIVDAQSFMLALLGEAEALGAGFAFNTNFLSARKLKEAFIITAADNRGEIAELSSTMLINCAGHGAHEVAQSVEGYAATKLPPRYLAKGSYCSVSGKAAFRHLIYPVPVPGALGIHATLDLAGAVRFGPDILWTDALDYSLPEGLPEKFAAAVEAYWPDVRSRTLLPSYCGIRPKLHGPGSGFSDFQIQNESDHEIVGLMNFFGIESPGLTASLAVAKHVVLGLARSS